MPDTQVRLEGAGMEWLVEVTWEGDADDQGSFIEIQDLWIVGYFPEPNGKAVGTSIRGDFALLSAADERTIREAIDRDVERMQHLAEEAAAESEWELRNE